MLILSLYITVYHNSFVSPRTSARLYSVSDGGCTGTVAEIFAVNSDYCQVLASSSGGGLSTYYKTNVDGSTSAFSNDVCGGASTDVGPYNYAGVGTSCIVGASNEFGRDASQFQVQYASVALPYRQINSTVGYFVKEYFEDSSCQHKTSSLWFRTNTCVSLSTGASYQVLANLSSTSNITGSIAEYSDAYCSVVLTTRSITSNVVGACEPAVDDTPDVGNPLLTSSGYQRVYYSTTEPLAAAFRSQLTASYVYHHILNALNFCHFIYFFTYPGHTLGRIQNALNASFYEFT